MTVDSSTRLNGLILGKELRVDQLREPSLS